MRVLFCASDMHGHALPLLPLATALKKMNQKLRFVTGSSVAAHIESHGIPVRALMPNRQMLNEQMVAMTNKEPHRGKEDRTTFAVTRFAQIQTNLTLKLLLREFENFKPELIIYECYAWAAPLAAQKLSIPSLSHGFGMPLPHSVLEAHSKVLTPIWLANNLSPRADAGLFSSAYIDIWPKRMQTHRSDLCTGEQCLPMRFNSYIPSLTTARQQRHHSLRILVTLGTVAIHADKQLPIVIQALQNVKQAHIVFLMGSDKAAIEAKELIDKFAWSENSTYEILAWADIHQIMIGIDLIISHGGAGTLLAAAAQGIPQLLLPNAADQFDNADSAVAAGIAMQISTEHRHSESIKHAIDALSACSHSRDAALTMALEIQKMPSSAEVAQDLMEQFKSAS
jgi:UDP:flavonoid glycosyltransferase YjiC (YdhE family)